jgi:hypothetical protein
VIIGSNEGWAVSEQLSCTSALALELNDSTWQAASSVRLIQRTCSHFV